MLNFGASKPRVKGGGWVSGAPSGSAPVSAVFCDLEKCAKLEG